VGAAVKAPTKAKQETTGLMHLVPDSLFAQEYVSRRIEGVKDIDLLRYAKAARTNVMLFGPTGPGKTSLVLAYAATDKQPLVTVQCNGAVDPETFWGGLSVDLETGALKGWEDSEITQVVRHGGILYLDEVNFLPAKVAATFHGLLDKRRQITLLQKGNEVVPAHPDLQVITAYNPDYEGTRPLNAAFKNRFKIKIRFDYDENVERELICLPVMLELAKKLRLSHKAADLETPVSTNMLIEFEELAVDLGYGFAVSNFLNAFSEDERGSVTEVFDLFSERIKEQLVEMEKMAQTS
jgi:nitric oxide reductase NorQ protein